MTRPAVPRQGGHGWQLILADLALILFLLTLSALPAAEAETGKRLADRAARGEETQAPVSPEIAPAQALYRPLAGGPSLSVWLAAQQRDPRATLTIFAAHPARDAARAWQGAEALAAEARARGVRVRTIITVGEEADLYASLAYDEVIAGSAPNDHAS